MLGRGGCALLGFHPFSLVGCFSRKQVLLLNTQWVPLLSITDTDVLRVLKSLLKQNYTLSTYVLGLFNAYFVYSVSKLKHEVERVIWSWLKSFQ